MLYERTQGIYEGFTSYTDYLIVTNYKNKSLLFKQLDSIAKRYLDTSRAKNPISDIFFIGLEPGETMPSPTEDYFGQERSRRIATIGYNNWTKEGAAEKRAIENISIWKNGEVIIDVNDSASIDSVINSMVPIDAGLDLY